MPVNHVRGMFLYQAETAEDVLLGRLYPAIPDKVGGDIFGYNRNFTGPVDHLIVDDLKWVQNSA
jgi:hypothetical protein